MRESTPISTTFADLGFKEQILTALAKVGYTAPTEIQANTIPVILQGKDLVAQSQTGSGKTAAFLLPAIQQLSSKKGAEVLVLVPTRELAQQVVTEAQRFLGDSSVRCVSVIGGAAMQRQIEMVNGGAKIVVATPGRLLDHIRSNRFKSFAPHYVVLDEADEILEMGFIDDVRAILAALPSERQTLLFSATMPPPIRALADRYLRDPVSVKLTTKGELANNRIEQILHVVRMDQRQDALVRILEAENPEKAIIFCRTRMDTDELAAHLNKVGIKAQALHGDLSQAERNRIISEIKRGVATILVATDVASRGLDIDGMSHVFNHQLPENADRFIHRVGRTGRGGRQGKAITLVTDREWQAHPFFRQYPRKNFTIMPVPTKSATQQLLADRMTQEIKKVAVCPSTVETFKALPAEEVFEFMCQLFTFVTAKKKVRGEEVIGFNPQALMAGLKEVSSRPPFKKRGGPSFRGNSSRPMSGGYMPPRRFGNGGPARTRRSS
jgi:ATP-dependent RNA helicase DeaD